MTKKVGITLFSVLLLLAFLTWLFIESSKPLPGTKVADLGRGHVPIGEVVDYNSSPPTSGKHYEEWIRAGVYAEPKDDRNLVHSLEHGYIIMYYQCSTPVIMSETKDIKLDSSSAKPAQNDMQGECKTRQDQLAKIYESKGKSKLIVTARPNLDTNFALTAWTYLDKFDNFDALRIEKFIDAHINMGPEKTIE